MNFTTDSCLLNLTQAQEGLIRFYYANNLFPQRQFAKSQELLLPQEPIAIRIAQGNMYESFGCGRGATPTEYYVSLEIARGAKEFWISDSLDLVAKIDQAISFKLIEVAKKHLACWFAYLFEQSKASLESKRTKLEAESAKIDLEVETLTLVSYEFHEKDSEVKLHENDI